MADSSKTINTVVELGVVVGVAFAIYEWLKTQCSSPASLMQGTSICSMFDSVFGITVPVPLGIQPTGIPAGGIAAGGVPPTGSTAPPPAVLTIPPIPTPPIPPAVDPTGLATQLQIASGGAQALNADQWSYYLTQLKGTPLTAQQFASAFPSLTATNRGGNMTAAQFASALQAQGLSGWAFPLAAGGLGIPYEWIHEPWLVNESGGLGDFPDWLKRLLPPPWGTATIFRPKLPPVPPPCLWPNSLDASGQCVAPPPPPPPPPPPVVLQRLFALPDWSPTVFTPTPPPPPPPPVCMWPNGLDAMGNCVPQAIIDPLPPPPPPGPPQRLFPLPDWSPRVFTPMPPIQTPLINMGPVDGLVGIPYHMIHDPGVSF